MKNISPQDSLFLRQEKSLKVHLINFAKIYKTKSNDLKEEKNPDNTSQKKALQNFKDLRYQAIFEVRYSLLVFYVAPEFKRSLMIKTVKIQIIVGTIAPQFVGRKPQKSNAC